jgi:hypothetical protein
VASTTQVREWYHLYRCSQGVRRPEGFFGRHPVYEQEVTHDAVNALEQGHLGSGYVPESDGFIGSKRQCPYGIGGRECQPDGTWCSIHNYCLAYDIEYNYNKHIKARTTPEDFDKWWFPTVCKYTLEQVRAIEGIKNVQGEQMWFWLGWLIGDFMHWQINVPEDRLEVDWNTVPGHEVDDDMPTEWPEPDAWALPAWNKAKALGGVRKFTDPDDGVEMQEFFVLLNRIGVLDILLALKAL